MLHRLAPFLLLPTLAAGGVAITYGAAPMFFNQVDPQIASVSWLVCRGDPAYHSLSGPERYALLYGPLLYIAHCGVMSLVGPSLASAKLFGVAAFLVSLAGMAAIGHRFLGSWRAAAVYAGFLAMFALLFGYGAFSNRPSPFLLALSALAGLIIALVRQSMVAAGLMGLILGASFNFQVHGPLYTVPLVVPVLFASSEGVVRRLVVVGTAGLVAAAAPAVADPNQYMEYLSLLLAMSAHDFWLGNMFMTSTAIFVLFLPVAAALAAGRWRRIRRDEMATLATLLLACGLIIVISGKAGAGWHHALPFAPVTLTLAAWLYARPETVSNFQTEALQQSQAWPGRVVAITTALALILLPRATLTAETIVSLTWGSNFSADLRRVLERHGDHPLLFGYTDNAHYAETYVRPLLVFAGHPYVIDAVAEMDLQYAGIPFPESTLTQMLACDDIRWVLPAIGLPFSLNGFYPHQQPLYPETVRDAFRRRFLQVERIGAYAVYRCNTPGASR